MGLLTSARNTPFKDTGTPIMIPLPVEAGTTIYLGGLVAVDASGMAVPATSVAGMIAGVAMRVVGANFGEDAHNIAAYPMIPNPVNLGAAGAVIIEVRRCIALLDINDGTVGQAQVGQMCFAADDHSVSMNDGWGEPSYVNETHSSGTSPFAVTLTHVTGGVSGVSVHSTSGGGTIYAQGLDYTFVPTTGVVTLIPGGPGGIVASTTYYFDYMNTTVEPVVVAAATAATIPTAALGYHLDLKHENIVVGSFIGSSTSVIGITDTTQSSVLAEGVDFDVDYQAGIITFIPGAAGTATAGDTLSLGYRYKGIAPTAARPVAGRIWQIETTYGSSAPMAWVNLNDQAVAAV